MNQTRGFMKIVIIFLSLFSLIFSPLFSEEMAKEKNQAENTEIVDVDQISHAIGHLIARQFLQPGFAFNFDKVIQGMIDAKAGKEAPMNDEEIGKALANIQEIIFQKLSEENLVKANDFLHKNMTDKGIVSLEEKLQYKITQTGSGQAITANATPLIHYQGKLLDGSIFGNSYEDGEPISLPLQQSIPGFSKGMLGMKEGEKRTLYIHPDLAYGVHGHLPPNSLLIFDIELVKADSPQELQENGR